MRKYQNLNYNQCVEMGKDLLQQRKEARINICLLTLRVCDIQIGGHHKGSEIYSMAKFAGDIGMNKYTLRKWMEDFRNVEMKLPKMPKPTDSRAVREVAKIVNRNTTKEEVTRLFIEHQKLTDDDFKLISEIKNAKAIRNFAYEYDFSKLNQDQIDELHVILKSALEAIESNILRYRNVYIRNDIQLMEKQ